jgi:hypothetical protein
MNSIIQYRFFTPYDYMAMYVTSASPLATWFAFGKIAENPVVTPTTSVQVIKPSAVNRYLQSVTVEAVTTTPTA